MGLKTFPATATKKINAYPIPNLEIFLLSHNSIKILSLVFVPQPRSYLQSFQVTKIVMLYRGQRQTSE